MDKVRIFGKKYSNRALWSVEGILVLQAFFPLIIIT